MEAVAFFAQVVAIMQEPPEPRHAALAALHTAALDAYLGALRRISPAQAQRQLEAGSTRNLIQVVGHLAAWDRFGILAASDILAGLAHPRTVTSVAGYVETDGQIHDFASVDEFNAYQAARHADWPWEPMAAWAADVATTLHALFTQPHLVTAVRLEQTLPHRKPLHNGGPVIEQTTMGWTLWLLVLEHLAVEHAADLDITDVED
jgi:hypothetical protein